MKQSEIYRTILDCLGTPRTTIDELGYDALCEKIEGIMGNSEGIPHNEADYIEKPFDLAAAKEHPEWVYTKNGDKVEELVKFNTARHDYQYACTIDGVLETFRSGNDFVLRVPVKKVKKWVVSHVLKLQGRVMSMAIHRTKEEAEEYAEFNGLNDAQYHEIEVEE